MEIQVDLFLTCNHMITFWLIDCVHGLTRVDTARRISHNEIKIDMDICGTLDSCDTVRGWGCDVTWITYGSFRYDGCLFVPLQLQSVRQNCVRMSSADAMTFRPWTSIEQMEVFLKETEKVDYQITWIWISLMNKSSMKLINLFFSNYFGTRWRVA